MDLNIAKEQIRQKINLVDVVSQYAKLEKSGHKYKCKSPFSNEKTPSFYIDPDQDLYYCFSTQKGGDLFNFIQEMEGVDFMGAMKQLAEKTGVSLDTKSKGDYKPQNDMYDILAKVKDTYVSNMSEETYAFLEQRGIDKVTAQKWEIGFAPDAWDTVCKKGIDEVYLNSGMCIKKDKNVYDRFRNRIMFPFYNRSGKIVGFSGRTYKGDDSTAKYINSPETTIFHKSEFLFGLFLAKQSIRKLDASLLVEGPIDVIMSHKAGMPIAVAISGTSFTDKHLKSLQQLSNRVIIALDGDDAGVRAAIKASTLALKHGMEVKVAKLPTGKDPADIVKENPKEWKDIVKASVHFKDFLFEYILDKYGDSPEDRARGIKEVLLDIIVQIKEPITKDLYIKFAGEFCGITPEAINSAIKSIKESRMYEVKSFSTNDSEKERLVEEIASFFSYSKKHNIDLNNDIVDRISKLAIYFNLERKEDLKTDLEESDIIDVLNTATKRLLVLVYKEKLRKVTDEMSSASNEDLEEKRIIADGIRSQLSSIVGG